MSVYEATETELRRLGEAAERSVEGQAALVLAQCLDSGSGFANGGLASTVKQLGAEMDKVRERHRKPEGKSILELLRGGADATG